MAILAVMLLGQLVSLAAAHAEAPKRDWDVRCCLEEQDLDNVFAIELAGVEQPVGHLSVVTPAGTIIGFDASSETFSHTTTKEGLYALGPRPQASIDAPSWNHYRYALLYRYEWYTNPKTKKQMKIYQALGGKLPLSNLEDGRYLVRVVALYAGRYTLRFYPLGHRHDAAAEFGGSSGIAIKPGETHEYGFDGSSVQVFSANTNSAVQVQSLDVKRVR